MLTTIEQWRIVYILIYSIERRQEGGAGQNPAPNAGRNPAPPSLPAPYVALRFWWP